ncbi:MAG: tRNA (N6-isopentenyl adenosine(37)-C2)-methylthiotransferase MiaB [bacterium]
MLTDISLSAIITNVHKSYFIKTYGCQMNVNDSEVIAGLLERAGYGEANSPETADIILINTCCVRQKAEDKAFGYALGLLSNKMRNPKRIFAFIGCIAEKDRHDIFRKLPFFDLVVGPGQEARIVQLIEEAKSGSEKIISTGEFCGEYPERSAKRKPAVRAFVTIMIGCDNFCSYCIVPYVRGREVSRPKEEILDEVRGLDKKIFKEIVLLGQNVNSYKYGLADILCEVHRIDGIERIRFLTSHPRDMTDDIIDVVGALPKVCEYFHLPLQSGDDDILKMMNRGYTSDHYRKLIDKIRKKIPDASITSDVIAGFPGETDRQFRNTLKLIKELELDLVNTLAFSARPGTAAAKMKGQTAEKIKKERLQELMRVVEETAGNRNKKLKGTIQEVLVEQIADGKCFARTRGNKVVRFSGEKSLIGKLVSVRITDPGPFVLEGELVN